MEKTIKKTDIWSIFMYLVLYSMAGFAIETIFGILSKGVIESRKSFLYGPFCAIYGIGAIAMIVFLKKEKNIGKIFIKGAIIGAVVEYLMSFICEKIWGMKWWDYSGWFLNINGRTCLFFAVSWGILAILLLKIVNPGIDKLIEMLRKREQFFKISTLLLILFFCADAILTGYALRIFYYRMAIENNLNIENKINAEKQYAQIQNEDTFASYISNYYDDETMLKTYPNMMIEQANHESINIDNLIDGFESYYYRLGSRE